LPFTVTEVSPVVISLAAVQVAVLKRWNVIVPPAPPVAPLIVAVSLIGFPIAADAVALVTNEEQFVMFTFCGEMKSFSSAENDVDERLFRYADPKLPQVPPDGNRVEKASAASPNV